MIKCLLDFKLKTASTDVHNVCYWYCLRWYS